MGAIGNFISSYSSNFQAALLLWPFFSIAFTLPILAYLYHRDGRLKATGIVATYLAVLYALGIVCFTLYPLPAEESGLGITYGVLPQWNPFGFIGDIAKDGIKAVFQLAFNIVFFMPFGFIAGRLLRMRLLTATLFALGVSVLIETAQLTGLFGLYPYAFRCCDVDDVICNTLGGILGWLCARALGSQTAEEAAKPLVNLHPGFIRRCVAMWIDLSIIGLIAFMPWMIAALASELIFSEPFRLFGLSVDQTTALCVTVMSILAFCAVEIAIPWMHSGSTPGGAFVRMTFESHERSLLDRVLFYVFRIATIVTAFLMPMIMFIVLGIFFLVKRCMPYDQVP